MRYIVKFKINDNNKKHSQNRAPGACSVTLFLDVFDLSESPPCDEAYFQVNQHRYCETLPSHTISKFQFYKLLSFANMLKYVFLNSFFTLLNKDV